MFFHLTQRKLTENEAKICFAEVLLGMEQLHKNKVLYRDLKVLIFLFSLKILWWILTGIFALEILDSVGSIWKGKIWPFRTVEVLNTWPTRPGTMKAIVTPLTSTLWELLSTKWSREFLPTSTASLFHSKTPLQPSGS